MARQVAVKAKYKLSVTPAERAAVLRVLATCPGQPTTRDRTHAPTRVDQNITDPGTNSGTRAAASGSGSGRSGSGSSGGVYYQNCDAVRAAGAAPIHAGDPGYDRRLDRDGDGVACE